MEEDFRAGGQEYPTFDLNDGLGFYEEEEQYESVHATPIFFQSDLDEVGYCGLSKRSSTTLPVTDLNLKADDDEEYNRKVYAAVEELLIAMEGCPEVQQVDNQITQPVTITTSPTPPIPESQQADHVANPFVSWDSATTDLLVRIRVRRVNFKPFSHDSLLWSQIAYELSTHGCNVDPDKCRRKWMSIWVKYKTIQQQSVDERSTVSSDSWEHFSAIKSYFLKCNELFNQAVAANANRKRKRASTRRQSSTGRTGNKRGKKKLTETLTSSPEAEGITNSSSNSQSDSSSTNGLQLVTDLLSMQKSDEVKEPGAVQELSFENGDTPKKSVEMPTHGADHNYCSPNLPAAEQLIGEDLLHARNAVAHDHCYAAIIRKPDEAKFELFHIPPKTQPRIASRLMHWRGRGRGWKPANNKGTTRQT